MNSPLATLLENTPVVPVIVIDRLADAVPLARALVEGGLRVLEITLRTPVAMDAMRAILAEVPDAIVGAGTVLDTAQMKACDTIGCAFAVAPGSTPRLLAAARDAATPLLPGAATASEAMALLEEGYEIQKFFPAEPAGGTAYLASLGSPLPQVRFCPTGGINPANAPAYLKLKNVITIGGSWMLPRAEIEAGNWAAITALARTAAGLRAS